MDRIVYSFYWLLTRLLGVLPLTANFRIGQALGQLGYWLFPAYRALVIRNLEIAFSDEKSPREIRTLAQQHFRTLVANMLCSIKIEALSPAEIQRIHTLENHTATDEVTRRGKGIILVVSHMGNWELYAQIAPQIYSKTSTVYQALGNRFIDAEIRRTRARFGVVLFERKDGFNAPIKYLRANGLVSVLVDQHAGDAGIWSPLFGKLASTSPLAAMLALRTGAVLLPATIFTDGCARWRVIFGAPIDAANHDLESLTARVNQVLEQQIRESPADWFWVHNRWKTPEPRFLFGKNKRGIALPEGFAAESLKPFRILIRSSNWLGDAVMTVPAVRAIKRGRPDARVTILTKAKLADFWKTVRKVDEVIAIGEGESVFKVARKIRDRFDVAIIFPNSVRSALECWLAKVPKRIGYRAKWRAKLLNEIVPQRKNPAPPEHQAHHYLRIAKFVGANIDDAFDASANHHLPLTINSPNTKIKIGICAGAEYGAAKRWLPERFAETAQRVSAQIACEWLIFGTQADLAVSEQIAAALGAHCTNLTGKTTLAELIEQLAQCDLLLTNDTGTMHLAAHLGVPTVSIFGSTEPALTGPLGANYEVLRHHVECSPCFLRECPLDFRCMKAVTVDEVAAAVLKKVRDLGKNTPLPPSTQL